VEISNFEHLSIPFRVDLENCPNMINMELQTQKLLKEQPRIWVHVNKFSFYAIHKKTTD